jgi:high affinity sulfate transporter 1
MAYARLAGLQPVSGLWAAIAALVAYALLGSSSRLSVGPESASAILVGSAVSVIAVGAAPPQRATVAAALAVAVSIIALVAWAAHLGWLADLLSRPVLVGYMGGVAVVMIVSQLPNLTGITSSRHSTLSLVGDVAERIGEVQIAPLLLGVTVVGVLLALGRYPRVPGPLLVVLAATVITSMFGLSSHGVATIGHVPRSLPAISFPGLPARLWPTVFAAAAGISVVVFSDNILTARAFAARVGERIDANQELLALSGANATAGFIGGFPVSSSGTRTALADAAGGSNQLVSLVAAAGVLLVVLFAGGLLQSFPVAALAGLVIYAALRLVDVQEARRIARFRISEALILLAAFAGVVLFGVLVGIAVAVGLSIAELFARIARAHDAVQGAVPGLAGLHDVDDYPSAITVPGLIVYRYDAPLCFANAEDFRTRVMDAVNSEPRPVEWVVLNMEANVEIDLTAVDMLEELRTELASRGIELALARVKRDLNVYLGRSGFRDRIGAEHIFPTLPTALEGFRRRRGGPQPSRMPPRGSSNFVGG